MDAATLIAEFEKLTDRGGLGVKRNGSAWPHPMSIPTVRLEGVGTEGYRRLTALGFEAIKLFGIESAGYRLSGHPGVEWWNFVLDQAGPLVETESRFTVIFDDEKVPLKSEKIQDAAYASAFVIKKCFMDGAVTKSADETEPMVEVKADPVYKPDGWTQAELHRQVSEHIKVSPKTIRRVMDDAGIPKSQSGGKGQQKRYGKTDVLKMVWACQNGTRQNKDRIAKSLLELVDT